MTSPVAPHAYSSSLPYGCGRSRSFDVITIAVDFSGEFAHFRVASLPDDDCSPINVVALDGCVCRRGVTGKALPRVAARRIAWKNHEIFSSNQVTKSQMPYQKKFCWNDRNSMRPIRLVNTRIGYESAINRERIPAQATCRRFVFRCMPNDAVFRDVRIERTLADFSQFIARCPEPGDGGGTRYRCMTWNGPAIEAGPGLARSDTRQSVRKRRVHRRASDRTLAWPDAIAIRKATGIKVGYGNRQTLETSATDSGVTPGHNFARHETNARNTTGLLFTAPRNQSPASTHA